jgi:hypothetical protein
MKATFFRLNGLPSQVRRPSRFKISATSRSQCWSSNWSTVATSSGLNLRSAPQEPIDRRLKQFYDRLLAVLRRAPPVAIARGWRGEGRRCSKRQMTSAEFNAALRNAGFGTRTGCHHYLYHP